MKSTSQSIFVVFALAALFLIQGCASYVVKDSPPLHEATLRSNLEEMKRQLNQGASPNELDHLGFSPMHWAASNQVGKHKEMFELLGKYGGNPNIVTDNAEMTPLHFVKHVASVDALIKLGANVNSLDISKSTPLHRTTDPKVAIALLKHGADPTIKDITGHKPVEAIRAKLQYYRGDGIMATLRQNAEDTATAIENYKQENIADSTSPDTNHPQDEFLMVVEGEAISANNDDVPKHYTDSNYKPSESRTSANRASTNQTSSNSEMNTYTGMTFHENVRELRSDLSISTPAVNSAAFTPSVTTGGSAAIDNVPPMPAYYTSKDTSKSSPNESMGDDFAEENAIDFDAAEKEAEKLEAAQACPMQEYDWYYTGKDCKDELAHGKGKAINPFEGMYFEGMIEAGHPAEGTLYRNNKEVFEGSFKSGKPNGEGICFYQGEPEECKYYKGKRIDSLHKQRQEFERQRKLIRSAQ